ncbi:MAG: IMP dehydrogenase [candidate division Zixibacteria bacterium]|nr:IMP dehydrogenase [candidate division Zixibacteria bacterium]NIR66938.1 IMP dehydrogenase [candidate division Zixibacteria bacterium]NIS17690.1 IMP dehydrogenase [candidate division Zixibacteria bacterium]NIS48401.1 IMP dehydrogenase [candidate division Zixibacteria bacterium]NIT52481.1 IMP dehydrogenase [candidate division Zixibacteria bacterium]
MEDKIIGTALTFDDILLVPAHSKVLPKEADVSTRLVRDITLNIPVVASAMDTVCEAELAIALARQGGLGFIHKNMSAEQQAVEVDKVKRSESGMIVNPITLSPDEPIGKALEFMERFSISGIPITENNKLVGIITNRDLRFHRNLNLKISDVMTKDNLITVPPDTDMERAKDLLHENRIEKLPIVDEEGYLKGMITVKDIMKKIMYPNACKDDKGRLRVGAAVGVSGDMLGRARLLVDSEVDVLVIDSSHGHHEGVLNAVRKIKKNFPDVALVAGNVAMEAGAEALIKAGAECVKVGIGPGSICTTRVVTGAGVPQATAIMNCAKACQKHDIPLIADGGVKYSGDITKAIACGADCVMIGSLFAGTKESPGEIVLYDGRSYKVYRGMGSIEAMRQGSGDRYFQHNEDIKKLVPEGIEGRVPYKGELAETIYQLIGGLRAGMGVCGTKTIADLKRDGRFVQITNASLFESHPHDVQITKEAPNYRSRM